MSAGLLVNPPHNPTKINLEGGMLSVEELRHRLQTNDWFRGSSNALQDALIAHGRERRLRAGEHLFRHGSASGGLYGVLGGAISVQANAPDETSVLLVLEPCHWFGELALIDRLPRSHDAVADTDSLVWCVPQAPLEAWLEAHPRHWREIAQLASGKLRIAFQIFDQEVRSPMTERVARRLRLATLGWGWRRDAPRDNLRLSQEQLSRMLGTSRSSVNKSLRELEVFGAIALHYGAIEVKDSTLLLQACGHAAAAHSHGA
ncbi:MAG TPA: Crp/Fnr family transcriptional regulator [Burkholderiaceae bacterium]|nr:Crp/Fnr family transcriptional regulator [Burkholderiaceae bacterium]